MLPKITMLRLHIKPAGLWLHILPPVSTWIFAIRPSDRALKPSWRCVMRKFLLSTAAVLVVSSATGCTHMRNCCDKCCGLFNFGHMRRPVYAAAPPVCCPPPAQQVCCPPPPQQVCCPQPAPQICCPPVQVECCDPCEGTGTMMGAPMMGSPMVSDGASCCN
jgi:hypothetical protein